MEGLRQKTAGQIVDVKVSVLKASPHNRTDLGNGELKELAASIKERGVLQPIIIRQGYEIVCGHRRWAAAKSVDLETIPCIMKELSDEEAMQEQIIENLQRKNLGPIEEAKALSQLAKKGLTMQGIGDSVGKPAKYVIRALSLLNLPAAAIKALENGTISAAHGHQLLRVGPKQMDAMVKFATAVNSYLERVPTLDELRREISKRATKDLASAPFPKDCAYATKIACVDCPYNTGNQGVLFDGAKEGSCTNSTCFASKIAEFYRQLQKQGEAKWPRLKYIGAAAGAYGQIQTIKGYRIVDEKDPKIKKAIAVTKDPAVKGHETVKGFGFGIVKPSAWSSVKKPKLVVLKEVSGGDKVQQPRGYRDPTPEEREKQRYMNEYVQREMAALMFTQVDFSKSDVTAFIIAAYKVSWRRPHLLRWLNAAGANEVDGKLEITKAVAAMDPVKAVALVCWIQAEIGEADVMWETLAEQNEIDLDKERKRSNGLALKSWEENKTEILAALKDAKDQAEDDQ